MSDLRREAQLELERAPKGICDLVDTVSALAPSLTTMEIGKAIVQTYLQFFRQNKDSITEEILEEAVQLILARDYFEVSPEDIPAGGVLNRIKAMFGTLYDAQLDAVKRIVQRKLSVAEQLFEVTNDAAREHFAMCGLIDTTAGATAELARMAKKLDERKAARALLLMNRRTPPKRAAKRRSPGRRSPSKSPPKRKKTRSPKRKSKSPRGRKPKSKSRQPRRKAKSPSRSSSRSRSPKRPCSRRNSSRCTSPCEWNRGRGCRKEGYTERPRRGTGCYRARKQECEDNEKCKWEKYCKVDR
jgi:hypothetical protein